MLAGVDDMRSGSKWLLLLQAIAINPHYALAAGASPAATVTATNTSVSVSGSQAPAPGAATSTASASTVATATSTAASAGLSPAQLSATEILARADEIRSPSGSYQMQVEVESSDGSKSSFQVDISGKDATLIKSQAPAREVGKNFLMIGQDMWAYLPNIRRSIRVALNQKLSGQAVNGDISRMRWRDDYEPTLEKDEADAWILLLRSISTGTTYEGVRVWIAKDSFRPIKGEFLTKSGRILKRVQYAEYRDIGGGLRPTVVRIENADKADEFSVLRIISMREKEFSSSHFTQSALQ